MNLASRRSLPVVGGLSGLVVAVFVLAALAWGASVVAIGAAVTALVLVQYLVGPAFIERFVPATVVPHDGVSYMGWGASEQRLGTIVARRCRDAGLPLVKLGIIDDSTPNAFTFGRTRHSARVWVSQGLLDRLGESELDAVVCHELGHVKHRDFVVMTVAAVIPLFLYWVADLLSSAGDNDNGGEAALLALVVFTAYILSEILVLALSRAREYGADRWSCECTADGDALASALVKVAYGIVEERDAFDERITELAASGREGQKEAAKRARRHRHLEKARALGIMAPRSAVTLRTTSPDSIDHAVAAMRWEVVNPWAAVLEKMSSHPLVSRRIAALERSGLQGAPRRWSIARSLASLPVDGMAKIRRHAFGEMTIAVAPWLTLLAAFIAGDGTGSSVVSGAGVALAGALFVLKQQAKYPMRFQESAIAPMLDRLDASPMAGIGVEVRGRVIGRGMPGYVLSPDLVIQDDGAFVSLEYKAPIPFAATLFGLRRAGSFKGRDVVATGWYRRTPAPVIELRRIDTIDTIDGVDDVDTDGKHAKGWTWMACWCASVVMTLVGVAIVVAGSF